MKRNKDIDDNSNSEKDKENNVIIRNGRAIIMILPFSFKNIEIFSGNRKKHIPR